MTNAQIHRFGDCVALYVTDRRTIYLTPIDAKRLAKALNVCAKDVKGSTFQNSEFVTTAIKFEPTGYNGCDFKIKRKGNDK